jgi:hypothetical protein
VGGQAAQGREAEAGAGKAGVIVVANFGAGLFAVCAIAVIWSLVAGYVPARWPTGKVTRETSPTVFWFLVGIYGASGLAGLFLAIRFW